MTLQEKYGKDRNGAYDPWRIAAICVVLNRTRSSRAESVIEELLNRCPNRRSAANVEWGELETLLKPLGLSLVHTNTLRRLSEEMACNSWKNEDHPAWDLLYGVGEYASEALRLFVDGDTSFEPHDLYLREYRERTLRGGET